MVRPIPDDELKQMWEEFLTDYEYLPRLEKAADAYPDNRSFVIDAGDIQEYSVDFLEYLLKEPERVIAVGQAVLSDYYPPDTIPEGERLNLRVIGISRKEYIAIRDLRSEHIGTFVSMEGLVKKVTEVRPKLVDGVFRCRSCGALIHQKQTGSELTRPPICYEEQGGCGKKTVFSLVPQFSTFEDYQRIEIQEIPEGLRGGDQPARLPANLVDDLTGKISAGDRVVLHGILRSVPRKSGGQLTTTFDIMLDVNSYELERHDIDEFEPTPEDIERIIKEGKDPDLFENLTQSISPTIKGHEEVKWAIVLQMFGGVTKVMDDGTRVRGDIHILLFGDPGTAKSQLLRYAASLAPRGMYASGRSASAAGLTAAAVKDEFGEGRWVLEAGALVLADMGLAAIDELDKMDKNDRSSMHEAMEQQSITVNKAGISATLQSRCSVLAAANPKFGRFIQGKDFLEQLDIPPPLLSRFDLIFTIKDKPDEETDRSIASHILIGHQRGEARLLEEMDMADEDVQKILSTSEEFKPHFEAEFLKKYIAYAKKIVPLFTEEARKKLEDFYVSQRNPAVPPGTEEDKSLKAVFTARQMEGLIRLAEATARARLSSRVEGIDADVAIKLYKDYLEALGDAAYEATTAVPRSQVSRRLAIEEAIPKSDQEALSVEDITKIARATNPAITEDEVRKILVNMATGGYVYEPKSGYYKRAM